MLGKLDDKGTCKQFGVVTMFQQGVQFVVACIRTKYV